MTSLRATLEQAERALSNAYARDQLTEIKESLTAIRAVLATPEPKMIDREALRGALLDIDKHTDEDGTYFEPYPTRSLKMIIDHVRSCLATPEPKAVLAEPSERERCLSIIARSMGAIRAVLSGHHISACDRDLYNLADAVSALSAAQPSALPDGWHDIASAPKTKADFTGGTLDFLGWCPDADARDGGDRRICWWEPGMKGGRGCWWCDADFEVHPTLWMPLPPPPQGEKT